MIPIRIIYAMPLFNLAELIGVWKQTKCGITVSHFSCGKFEILKNEYSTSEIFQFIKDFKVTKGETKYINTTKSTEIIHGLEKKLHLPLTHYFLSETQIKSILKYKI